MYIQKVIRTQTDNGIVRTDYLLSSPVTLSILNDLSQGTYEITGRQYLSPTYIIRKPEDIELHGILSSRVIQVVHSESSAHFIQDYLSALLKITCEPDDACSLITGISDRLKLWTRIRIKKKNKQNNQENSPYNLYID